MDAQDSFVSLLSKLLPDMGGPRAGISDFLAMLDQKRRNAVNNVRDFSRDPAFMLQMMGRQVGEDLTQQARSGLSASSAMMSKNPDTRQAGMNQLLPTVLGLGPLQTVYHGSPHVFDKFDKEKAGKFGGTSFGLGHNFSESAGHASVYKGADGALYKVDIADEALPKMMQWELPVSSDIASKLPPLDTSKPFPFGGGATMEKKNGGWVLKAGNAEFRMSNREVDRMFGDANTGEQVWRKLTASLGSEDAAAAWLRDKGIPGIANSTERGTRNYVVFPGNEDLLKILGRE